MWGLVGCNKSKSDAVAKFVPFRSTTELRGRTVKLHDDGWIVWEWVNQRELIFLCAWEAAYVQSRHWIGLVRELEFVFKWDGGDSGEGGRVLAFSIKFVFSLCPIDTDEWLLLIFILDWNLTCGI